MVAVLLYISIKIQVSCFYFSLFLWIYFCVFVFQGLTNPLGKPVCSFDPDGLIFAAGVESQAIKLYDLRAFDKVKFKFSVLNVCVCAQLHESRRWSS